MTDNPKSAIPNPQSTLPFALAGALIASILWLPLLKTPYWQDDYGFLMAARIANQTGKSLWASFLPDSTSLIWRPLTTGLYWRILEPLSKGSPLLIHIMNYIIYILAVASMGCFAASLRKNLKPDGDIRLSAFAASLLYGLHGAFSLPMAWASGIQELGALLFSALALRAFIGVLLEGNMRIARLCALFTPIFLLAALFCKEGTVILIALMLLLIIWIRPTRPALIKWVILAICAVITIIWMSIRLHYVAQPTSGSTYSYYFGINIFRNSASFLAFSLGVSREAIRFFIMKRSLQYFVWAAICMILQGGAIWLIYKQARKSGLRVIDLGFIICIFIVGLSPYLLLKWNCYPYYALLGLASYAILSSFVSNYRTLFIVAILSFISTSILLNVESRLSAPAPLARARRAKRALTQIAADPYVKSSPRIAIIPKDQDLFSAMGWNLGLAYLMNRSPDDIPIYQEVTDVPREIPYVILEGDSNLIQTLQ